MTTQISIDHLVIDQYADEERNIHFRISRFRVSDEYQKEATPTFDFQKGDEEAACKFYSTLSKLFGIAEVLPDKKEGKK